MSQPRIPTLTSADRSTAVLTLVDDTLGRWNATTVKGAPATVQYSFATSVPTYTNYFSDTSTASYSFQTFSESMKATTREALAAWSSVANIKFVEVSDSSTVGMRFFSLSAFNNTAGFAWGAGGSSTVGQEFLGDIWINRAVTNSGEMLPVLLHEIGHTLGLKHPHEAPIMPSDKDSSQTTIMSYDENYFPILTVTATRSGSSYRLTPTYTDLEESNQAHLGVFDVAAVQAIYGARVDTSSNTYSFSADPFTKMIYDNGGNDTIDLSNQRFGSVLDLTPGSFSSIGLRTLAQAIDQQIGELSADVRATLGISYLRDWFNTQKDFIYLGEGNLSIAYDTIIETVVGTAYADKITGNDANNTITGGAGNDTIIGGAGTDTAKFSGTYSGNYKVATVNGSIVVSGKDGLDTLTGVEKLAFDDGTIIDTATVTATGFTASVYRFYNKASGSHFYTANAQERDSVKANIPSYVDEGVAFTAFEIASSSQYSPVYRFYNKTTGTHFYTISANERDSVQKLAQFSYDGTVYYGSTTAAGGLDPLYRFYNTTTGTHFYTASASERAAVTKLVGFVDEGIAYYVDA